MSQKQKYAVDVEFRYTVEYEAESPSDARAAAAVQAARLRDSMDNRIDGSSVGTSMSIKDQ